MSNKDIPDEAYDKVMIDRLKMHIKPGSKLFFQWTSPRTYQVLVICNYDGEQDIMWISYRLACLLRLSYDESKERIRTRSKSQYHTMEDITSELARKLGIFTDQLHFGRI